MKKVLIILAKVIVSLSLLSMFGWMVQHISRGDKNFGFLTEPVRYIYSFPDLFEQTVQEIKTLPLTFIPSPADFQAINRLESDFPVLRTYSSKRNKRTIELRELRSDSTYYSWDVRNPYKEHTRILNPILLPDKSIIYGFDGFSGLMKMDSLTNTVWKQDSIIIHHSMNQDHEGNIWVCAFALTGYATGHYHLDGESVFIKDNYIARLDSQTGSILFHKSIIEILAENGLSAYLLKTQVITDPLHLNDVEPALKTTPFYEVGDVFISLRSPSMVIHYRPATNRVIDIIQGPFASQHDVDFYGDSALVMFNNNYYSIATNKSKKPPKDSSYVRYAGDFYSNIVRYDFEDRGISYIGDSIFRANSIFTESEGLQDFADPHTYLVEEQNTGLIWIIRDDEVLYKNVFPSQHEGYHHLPNWTRVIQ